MRAENEGTSPTGIFMFLDFWKRFRETGSLHAPARRGTSVATSAIDPAWERWRDAPNPADDQLSAATQQWLAAQPTEVRPFFLAVAFPRIANRLALVWNDISLTDKVFECLLIDHRGDRLGFPGEISLELLRLHRFHEYRRPGDGINDPFASTSAAWEAHCQASADR